MTDSHSPTPSSNPQGATTRRGGSLLDLAAGTMPDAVPLSWSDPAVTAARAMLVAVLDRGRHWPRTSAEGACVVVRTPGPEWLEPVRAAWRAEVSSRLLRDDDVEGWPTRLPRHGPDNGWLVLTGSQAQPDAADIGALEHAVWTGQPVLGLAPDPAGQLPADLLLRADLTLCLDALTREQLRAVVAEVTGQACRGRIPATLPGRVTPRLLRLTRRIGQSPADYLRRLADLAEAGGAARPVSDPGPLARLHGVDEAVAWAKTLARDVALYRAGRLSWSDMDPGVLLCGPPGSGKTTLARAIAANAGLTFLPTSYGEWQGRGGGYLGDVVAAIRDLFARARTEAPCLLFIDELDAVSSRSGEASSHREWWAVIITLLLAELDGITGRPGVVVVGATNWPERIDPALLRAGRLDRRIDVPLPDTAAFEGILGDLVGQELPGSDLHPVALALLGRSGADAGQVVRGARRRAREAERPLRRDDLLREAGACDVALPPDEALRRAAHEAGHVVLAELVAPGSVPAASLRPGRPWAAAAEQATGLHDMLQVLLSGRAGEELLVGTPSGAAGGDGESDLALATTLVLHGITAGGAGPGLAWLGDVDAARTTELLIRRPDMAELVNARLATAYAAALARLREHSRAVAAVADALLPGQLVTGSQLRAVLREAGLTGDATVPGPNNQRLH